MGHLRTFDILAIGMYFVIVLLIGWWYSKRQKSTEEYFVAKRGANPLLVGLSLIASLLSTISYLSIPGELIKNGPGLMWGCLHIPLTFFVVGYLVIPRIMKYKITSAYELLENYFGMSMRQVAAILFVLVRLSWMSLIIYTCGLAVHTISGIPVFYMLLAVGIITTIYTVMGGIRALLITDTIQFGILFFGAIFVIAYVTYRCGGFSWWPSLHSPEIAALHWPKIKVFSFDPFDRVTVISAIYTTSLWWITTASSDQVAIQRYLCTRDVKDARKSFFNCLLAELVAGIVLWVVGVALLGFFLRFPALMPEASKSIGEQADNLFPYFIGSILPLGLTGILVAALFSAAMSCLSSGISSVGTVLLTDFKNFFGKDCQSDDRKLLKRARLMGTVIGLLATFSSYTIYLIPGENLMDLNYRIGLYFGVPLCSIFILAFFVPFSTPAGAWATIIVGLLAGVFFSFWQVIMKLLTGQGRDFSIILIMPAAMGCCLAAGIIVSLFTKRKVPGQENKLELLNEPAPEVNVH